MLYKLGDVCWKEIGFENFAIANSLASLSGWKIKGKAVPTILYTLLKKSFDVNKVSSSGTVSFASTSLLKHYILEMYFLLKDS